MASEALIDRAETLGLLTSELEILRDQAQQLFSDYENDATLSFLETSATEVGRRANRIALAFEQIRLGVAELG